MVLPKSRKQSERALYPLVQDYFETVRHMECWSEKELRRIQPRTWRGRFKSEGYPTPDLIAVDFSLSEVAAVEIKSNTTPSQLDGCIGKLMRMLRFANKAYGAFPHSIPKSTVDTFMILNRSLPQIGLLEVYLEKSDTPVVEHVTPTSKEATVRDEWRLYLLELPRARAIPLGRAFGALAPISHVTFDDASKHVIVEISKLAEDRYERAEPANPFRYNDPKRDLWMWIDSEIDLSGCREKYGKQTQIDLVSEHFTICSQCKHVKAKGESCVTCESEDRSGWEGEDLDDEDVSLRFEEE
jgi:hypothetical protein